MLTPNFISCPCKGCVPPKRNEYCHSNCEEYLEYSKKVEAEKEEIQKDLRTQRAINEINVQGASNKARPKSLKRKKN